ncbi:MAG TPA: peptidoglycan DD-metalloendopeptidase family protein [Candidatus Dormibacteraeota bacterium]|nr:peptidoglycan DD-metalloendopeptidase family protein [Candidatus Dormibacteraeota bacterium]
MQPVLAAGNLTLPFNIPNPRITSWMDHHYPDRHEDGIMIRFDGASGYAYDGHRGTDYAVPSNTPVVAADDGTVIYSEWSDSGGWGVVIDHATNRTAYFHNNQLFVYPGQHVSRGQLIALSGSTGNSTGPHVHFEVRDLLTPWHSIDPYGWTGRGQDPWSWDAGYLWTSNPPVPFLLPLAFFGGARWNYWYGSDGPPSPITWHLRDGGHGLAGFAAAWDADPGPAAARTMSISGTAAVPGPGSHTLHLRVFDRAGASADITYLYLYDVEPPTSTLRVDPANATGVTVHWTGNDNLSGVKYVAIDVAQGNAGFRPWLSRSIDQPSAGTALGGIRFLGQPGSQFRLRLSVRDAARNAAPPVVVNATIPAAAGPPATVNDRAILGELPEQPDGTAPPGGLRQEHPAYQGARLLSADASVQGLGQTRTAAVTAPASTAAAVDIATTTTGSLLLLADGSTWTPDGSPGPAFSLSAPVRLLAALDGTPIAVDAGGKILAGSGGSGEQVGLPAGESLVDAALFPSTHSGIALDSAGALHPFAGSDGALTAAPMSWTLPGQPAGITLAGTVQAPAGIVTDASGDWQTFGSLLLLPDTTFAGPMFDRSTGLPLR